MIEIYHTSFGGGLTSNNEKTSGMCRAEYLTREKIRGADEKKREVFSNVASGDAQQIEA